jgi:titin
MRSPFLGALALAVSLPAAADTFTVLNTNNDGTGSLRQAINDANGGAGNTVAFAIGSGAQTITLGSPLPSITHAMTIDGTTQPGYAGTPLIDVDGNGNSGAGLVLTAGSTTVKALVLRNFHGIGIRLQTNGSNVIQGCWIGTDGTSASSNTNGGITLESGSSANQIGGVSNGNVISGNGTFGISVCATCSGNMIQGNRIGTNAAGTAAIANPVGVKVSGTTTTVGGTAAGAGNVISGNSGAGVSLEKGATGAVVQGNLIGLNAAGTGALANSADGIAVSEDGATIGGAAAGAGNVLSGNGGNGVTLSSGTTGALIRGNLIGTNAAGTAAIANAGDGVRLLASSGNTIGGTTAGARNVISGNTQAAISVELNGSTANVIQGNFIGLNAAGTAAIANGGGIVLDSASNTIGGTAAGAGNFISGNPEGVTISGGAASSNFVQGNFIGTDVTGTLALGNGIGVRILGADANTVGGASAAARNVISGNTTGVSIELPAGSGNTVIGNWVGLDATGTAALANGVGIALLGPSNTVGGTTAAARNVISGNTTAGVSISGAGASGNKVQGSWIGTNATGTAAVGNATGIQVSETSSVTIGGTTAGSGNLVSGNAKGVVFVSGSLSSIQGNLVGTDPIGASALPNALGVALYSSTSITIGGTTAAARNVVSGNEQGIEIGRGSTGNAIEGNYVGTRVDGTTPLPNTVSGIDVTEALSNTIGGVGNVIAGNSAYGVAILTGNGNSILSNSMFGNGLPGIDLFPSGPIPNDDKDPDFGANLQQNYPVLFSAALQGGGSRVQGTLNSLPNTIFRVEIFGNPTCNASGFGEGKTFLIKKDLTTDANGIVAIDAAIGTTTPGAFITATATDPHGNTSEFSPCVAFGAATAGQLQFFSTTPSVSEGAGSAVITVVRTGGTTGAVSVHYATSDGTATHPGDYAATSGDLAFADGEVVKTFSVPVVNDGAPEGTETVNLTLSLPTGGAALGAQSAALLSILDYDAASPSVSIADASTAEGNSGTKILSFDVTMTPHSGTVLVDYFTTDGTATAGSDYVAASDTLTFGPAETLKTVDVTIDGDVVPELDEDFFVNLSNTSAGTIDRGQAEGVIVNDEALLGGDANGNGVVDIADVFFLINNLFAAGPPPPLPCLADPNGDGKSDIADVFFLINYLFANGPAPVLLC